MMKYEKKNSPSPSSPSRTLKPTSSLRQSIPPPSSPTSQRGSIFNYNGIITTPNSSTNKKFQLTSGSINKKQIKSDMIFSPLTVDQKEKEI